MAGAPSHGLYDPRDEHDACGVGFVVDIQGRKSHAIVRQALQVLINLLHRGACGCEPNTGDGAGILLQMPDRFLRRECARIGFALPPAGEYGAGLMFLPRDAMQADKVRALFHSIVADEGQRLLGWRNVPTDDRALGATARSVEPLIKQVFIGRGEGVADPAHFERKLYVIRKLFEKAVAALDIPENKFAYVPSLSSRTLIYKGMLSADQIAPMYPDLVDPDVESALALVHQRFSTNTFPSWPLAHPYRYIAHNGEINTLRGNINWMRAREALCRSDVLNDDDLRTFKRGVELLCECYWAAGAKEVYPPIEGIGILRDGDVDTIRRHDLHARELTLAAFHPLGTARADARRDHGVVDPDLKLYGADGVYVCDGSVVPSSIGVNPQITIMALATRLAYSLLDKPAPLDEPEPEKIARPRIRAVHEMTA